MIRALASLQNWPWHRHSEAPLPCAMGQDICVTRKRLARPVARRRQRSFCTRRRGRPRMGQAAQHQAAIMQRPGCPQSQPANSIALAGSRAVSHSGAKLGRSVFNLSACCARLNASCSGRHRCLLQKARIFSVTGGSALSSGMAALSWHLHRGLRRHVVGLNRHGCPATASAQGPQKACSGARQAWLPGHSTCTGASEGMQGGFTV